MLIKRISATIGPCRRAIHYEIKTKMKEKSSAKKLALEYFDFYYSTTFRDEWHGIRLALLTGQKHMALVNNYSDPKTVMSDLEKQTAINVFEYIAKKNKDIKSFEELRDSLHIPDQLKVYSFDTGETMKFRPPSREETSKKLNYYCMDGASLLPVLALGVKHDDVVLDLCSSPGGKSLALLQTMLISKIHCRDKTDSRLSRVKNMLRTYLPDEDFKRLVHFEQNTLMTPINPIFDKVLVDVPCTNDRLSLFKEENNIFSRNRLEERSNIPKIQRDLLIQGIRSCKLNGTIVYSTCSLSPIQNEGVVNTVVDLFKNESAFRLDVEPLEGFKDYFEYFFKFSSACKTGLLVTPDVKKNFGPFYLCKITKRKIQ